MDNNLKRGIILENYSNPFNKGLIDNPNYKRINMNNESCIDNIDIMMNVDNNTIIDIRFDGEACAISTSATSIIIKILLNKSIDEALYIIEQYENMIDEKDYDETVLGEAVVYNEIYKQPNRKKCALLPVRGIKKMLEEL
ncbi:MAG TPA: SUF system NifU family Fe-S cluster assembly protein [Mollicutes bacterium]|nr:SUF system NifU family Fe-S cluster assembly protein [Mollicutes bacterium]